jgi:phage baseplate assembly protein gpV
MAKESAPSISGTVSRGGQPAGGVYVRLVGPSGEFVAEEYTHDDGAFTFHVAAGTWTIEARAAGAETTTKSVDVSSGDATVQVDLQPA